MKKLLIFIFLVIIGIFLSKNIIIKEFLKYYLKSNLKTEASLEKVDLGFKKIAIDNADLVKDNLRFKTKRIEWGYNLNFPFQLSTDYLKVVDAQIKDQLLGSLNFNLIPFQRHHVFEVNNLLVRNKKIGDFSIFLKSNENKIYFYNLESNFINSSANISGHLNLSDLSNICIDLVIEDLSLATIVFLFTKKEDMSLEGHFNGGVSFCFKNNKISQLNLDINNLEGGRINLKKETSLDFLKNRLDKKSYRYLLDNLKNYKYDEGSIGVKTDKNNLILEANFLSEELGKRNIIIKLHKVFVK